LDALDSLREVYKYISPILDIGIMTFLLYKVYEIIIKTNGLQIIKAAILVGLVYAGALVFDLQVLQWLMKILAPGLAIGFVIVFQPELRKIFLKIGQNDWLTFGNRSRHTYVDAVIIAAETLSKMKKGMLVVFERNTKLDEFIITGTALDANISSALLVTIFGHETPLHDAACIVKAGKIVSAGCFLPLSEQYDIKKTFGTRHRAALGLSEQTDAVVLVVSEETGAISLAYESRLHYDLKVNQITKMLEKLLVIENKDRTIEDTIDESKATN